jgi:WD40 repeat protein
MIGAFADTQAYSSPIEVINSKRPLELGKFSIVDDDSVLSVDFSPNGGGLLAGVCISGQVKVWQVSEKSEVDHWPLLRVLRDSEEAQIDEFFTGNFLPNGQFVVAGKRKHRHQWNESTGEAQSLPGLLKFFDLKSGKCIRRLGPSEENFADKQKNSGHTDEVLFLKPISTASKGNFILSCGQDGRLCRWSFSRDWNSFLGVSSAKLGNLVFHCDQISDELVGVAVDNGLVIYDILNMKVQLLCV